MSVAPIDYDDTFTVTDAQYAAALRDQQIDRARRLWLVTADPDEEPLEVTVAPAGLAEQSELMAHAALALLEHVLRTKPTKTEVQAILAAAWPWTSHLPEHDVIALVDELGALLLGQRSTPKRDAAARQLLIEWEHTAEVWADPELRERLAGPLSLDGAPVLRPGDEAGGAE